MPALNYLDLGYRNLRAFVRDCKQFNLSPRTLLKHHKYALDTDGFVYLSV